MIPLGFFIAISAVMFCIGIFGVLTRRNAIAVLMSIELILNAANINLVAFNKYLGTPDGLGQIFALFVIAIAAAASVVGLVLIIAIYRHGKSVFVDEYNLMKW
ncbi:MAG: NADH-quinone oxidoreductase subunit K [Omnitrophica WOR_2 bacterium RIFCSPHIGHO2_01_FULL_48_9]|nr:MAG: NADH-quinone oxidoreductase subunit K [Omnitrophica WOR_2 bacterium RIFCSPHIGHO2_02_FULL_48_11]OGX32366.1 MAG: NADH-quinone oxidoreductase subunit K [Omnitrophica WOR_2 bacterium RIFCSPHIGHO2_01_FULL_48_9]